MFGRNVFNGISDSDLSRVQDLSKRIVERGEMLRAQNTSDEDFQELAHLVTQLGRITTLQTQALRSIR